MSRPPALAALALCACRAVSFDAPLPDDGAFDAAPASAEDLRRCRLAADWSQARGGVSLVVVRGRTLVCDLHPPDEPAWRPRHLYSGTKGYACALAALLAHDGLLDLDAPVRRALPEWTDERRARVTARQLLQLTSGLAQAQGPLTLDGLFRRQRIADKHAYALALPALREPGSTFEYGSAHLAVFAALARRLSGRDALDLLEERVFRPIGQRHAGWIRDPAGNPMLAYGAWTTAREWAKYGVLLRDGGRWHGRRVLDADAVRACLVGSGPMPAYGLGLWLNRPVTADRLAAAVSPLRPAAAGPLFGAGAPQDLFAAAGYGHQRLYVIPSRDLVVARLGVRDGDWSDEAFLARLLDGDRSR